MLDEGSLLEACAIEVLIPWLAELHNSTVWGVMLCMLHCHLLLHINSCDMTLAPHPGLLLALHETLSSHHIKRGQPRHLALLDVCNAYAARVCG
jgi:hypothetical protein